MSFQQKNNSPSNDRSVRRNELSGKVVLLVGNDKGTLPDLIRQLAQKGADIALLYQQLPPETVGKMKESVESYDRNLLLIDKTKRQSADNRQLIQNITTELGHLDVFIDLSAQQGKKGNGSGGSGYN